MSSVRKVLAAFSVLCALGAPRLCAETAEERYEAAKSRCEEILKAGNIPGAFDALYALRIPASALTNTDRHRVALDSRATTEWTAVLGDLVRLYTQLAGICEKLKLLEQAERAYVKGIADVNQLAPRITVTTRSSGQDITGPNPVYAHPLRMSLADFYIRTNQLQRALAELAREVRNNAAARMDVSVALKLAWLEARTGHSDYALKRFKELEKAGGIPLAKVTSTSDAEDHVALGDLYLELRRVADARTEYALAVDSGKLSDERQKEVQTKLTNLGGAPKK
jgi:predicted negative regulator of RcsB-dependent stress response